MQLPKTASLAVNGPEALPAELLDGATGFSWFEMIDRDVLDFIQPVAGERRRLKSLERSRQLLSDVLNTLVNKGGWRPQELFILGYGQGGTLALELLLGESGGSWAGRLGGVVAVAAELLRERQWQLQRQSPDGGAEAPDSAALEGTGVLLINGEKDQLVPLASADASAKILRRVLAGRGNVRLAVFADRGGEMLRGGHAEEMRLVMEFFADRLHGVGRRGSQEAMERLGAEPVEAAELVGEATNLCASAAPRLDEMD